MTVIAERRLLTETEAARYLGLSRSFLAQSRCDGNLKGRAQAPPFVQCGRAIRYDVADLDDWIDANRVSPPGVEA